MKQATFLSLLAVMMLFSAGASAQPGDCNPQQVTVHLNPDIMVTPPVLNQRRGCAVIFRVPNGHVTNIISNYDWLNGSSEGEELYIDVPEGTSAGDYKYDVQVEGVGYLDPIIRVSN